MAGLPTKIVPRNVLDTIKRSPRVYSIGRRVRWALGSAMGARRVPGVSSRVHYNDFMLTSPQPGHVASYLRGAVEFVGILEEALQDAGRDAGSIESLLEVGCGYGRIVREVKKRFDQTDIFVADVIDEGARFAASELNATRVPVLEHSGFQLDEKFDLIYLLSVYTHLRRDIVEDNLRRVERALKPGGIVVFSIHGEGSANTAERYEQYWLDKPRLLAAIESTGYYYEKYPYYTDEYGLTWFTRPRVEELVAKVAPSMSEVSYRPMRVDGHQDIFVYQKAG